MIIAENLKKTYGRVTAIEDVSFEVGEGEILGFLGPNGAGKTTTMRILTGYTPPSEGRAVLGGNDVKTSPLEVRKIIGYLPENTPLYLDMDVTSYLGFVAQVKNIPTHERRQQITDAMEETGILDVASRTIGKLSKGYRQRVGLAQALLGNPKILILDEPTVGLDPNQIREIRELIRNMAGRRTVILSTHILPEVSMICERVVIIHQGRIVAAESLTDLTHRLSKSQQIRMILKAPSKAVHDAFKELKGIQKLEVLELSSADGMCQVSVNTDPNHDLRPDLVNRVVGKNWQLYEIRSMEPTLEDIFVDIIAREKEVV